MWEVWRAWEKNKCRLVSALQTSQVHPKLSWYTHFLKYEPTSGSYFKTLFSFTIVWQPSLICDSQWVAQKKKTNAFIGCLRNTKIVHPERECLMSNWQSLRQIQWGQKSFQAHIKLKYSNIKYWSISTYKFCKRAWSMVSILNKVYVLLSEI